MGYLRGSGGSILSLFIIGLIVETDWYNVISWGSLIGRGSWKFQHFLNGIRSLLASRRVVFRHLS